MDEHIEKAEAYLASLPRFADAGAEAYHPGFDRIRALLNEMGNPHRGLRCIHVAGTNGKGSTASMIAAVATAAGRRTGLHTSPHLFHVTERLRVDGRAATRAWLADAIETFRGTIDAIRPSYFEATVALSFLYFNEENVETAVIEVGMGGRLDATNVVKPEVSVITDIGLDHVEHLGDTIAAIAREKAGIVKERIPVVTGAAEPAARVIRKVAAAYRAPFHSVDEETTIESASADLRGSNITVRTPVRLYHDLYVGLPGRHQIQNARTAIRAVEIALEEVRSDHLAVYDGLRHVRELSGLRARLEVLRDDPLVLADVGHNVDGLASALEHLRDAGRLGGRLVVLFGVMRDKNVREMARLLAAYGAVVWPVPIDSPRALPAAELHDVLKGFEIDTGEPRTVEEGIRSFLSNASHADILLVTGSHLVVSQLENASV